MPSELDRLNDEKEIIMNKEEILAKAREENKGADIAEIETQARARAFAGFGMLLIGTIVNLYCQLQFSRSFPVFWVMFFSYSAAYDLIRYILSRKNQHTAVNILHLIYGIFMAVMTVLAVVVMLRNLIRETA